MVLYRKHGNIMRQDMEDKYYDAASNHTIDDVRVYTMKNKLIILTAYNGCRGVLNNCTTCYTDCGVSNAPMALKSRPSKTG